MATMTIENYADQLLQSLDHQRQSQQHCDVVLISSSGSQYHAHSSVLAASSSFLHEQLKISSMTKQISLGDHAGEIIQMFLDVLYTGRLEVDPQRSLSCLDELKVLAQVIDVHSVIELCNKFTLYVDSCDQESDVPITANNGKHSQENDADDTSVIACCEQESQKSSKGNFEAVSGVSSALREMLKQPMNTMGKLSEAEPESVQVLKPASDSDYVMILKDDTPNSRSEESCTQEADYDEEDSVHIDDDENQRESQSVSVTDCMDMKPEETKDVVTESEADEVSEQIVVASVPENVKGSSDENLEQKVSDHETDETAGATVLCAEQKVVPLPDKVKEKSPKKTPNKDSHDPLKCLDTPLKRPRGRPRKGMPQRVDVEKATRTAKPEQKSKTSDRKRTEQEIVLSPTGRPRRRAAERNIYIGKPRPRPEEGEDSPVPDKSENNNTNHDKRRRSGNNIITKQEKQSLVLMPDNQQKRKRGRPPKLPSDSFESSAYKKARFTACDADHSDEEESLRVLFEDEDGSVYMGCDETENPAAVYESFSKITSQLLKYQMEGGPEKDAAATVANLVEQLEDLEFEQSGDTTGLREEINETFQNIVSQLETLSQQESGDKDNVTAPKKSPTGEALKSWKNCKYCSKFKGRKKGRYEFHVNYCNSNYKCVLCHKPFLNERDLEKHHCNKMDRWICDLCGKILSDKPTLQLHKKNHMGIKTKVCSFCGKTFMRSCHLQAHVAHVHKKQRPYRCTECDAAFALNYELNRHMQRHSETPNFTCTICGDSFYERIKLNYHVKSKHKMKKETVEHQVEIVEPTIYVEDFGRPVSVGVNQVEIGAAVDQIIQSAGVIEQKDGENGTEVQIVLHPGGLLNSYGYVAYQTQT